MRYLETFAVAAVAAVVGLAPLPSAAASRVDVYLGTAPPAVIYEPAPPPRVGYVWAPGYWDWNGHRHVWHRGHWEHERHGHRYVGGGWYQRDGRWYLNRPHWERWDNYSRWNGDRWHWNGDRWVRY
jgi:YXWGXW repeat-containing protein